MQCREERNEYINKCKVRYDKPSEIVTVFKHARHLLLNDEFLEKYSLICSISDNKVTVELLMNSEVRDISGKQPEQTSENKSFAKLHLIMYFAV